MSVSLSVPSACVCVRVRVRVRVRVHVCVGVCVGVCLRLLPPLDVNLSFSFLSLSLF